MADVVIPEVVIGYPEITSGIEHDFPEWNILIKRPLLGGFLRPPALREEFHCAGKIWRGRGEVPGFTTQ